METNDDEYDEILNLKAWVIKDTNNHRSPSKEIAVIKLSDAASVLNKAIAGTANRIFADLKAAAWEQIEPDKLKQFYKEFSEAKDEKAALEIAKKYSIVGFSAEKFDAIKKKHGVLK